MRPRHCERSEAIHCLSKKEWIASSLRFLAMTVETSYGLGLFDFFTQHFKFQPFVLCLLQILLRFRKCIRGLIEFLAIFLVEIGIVKVPLLLCDLRLQLCDGLR